MLIKKRFCIYLWFLCFQLFCSLPIKLSNISTQIFRFNIMCYRCSPQRHCILRFFTNDEKIIQWIKHREQQKLNASKMSHYFYLYKIGRVQQMIYMWLTSIPLTNGPSKAWFLWVKYRSIALWNEWLFLAFTSRFVI